jgi:hypothetical protein
VDISISKCLPKDGGYSFSESYAVDCSIEDGNRTHLTRWLILRVSERLEGGGPGGHRAHE